MEKYSEKQTVSLSFLSISNLYFLILNDYTEIFLYSFNQDIC